MGSRSQPLQIVITTAGTDMSSPCYDKRDQVVKVLKNVFQNEELFGIIYTIEDDDEWTACIFPTESDLPSSRPSPLLKALRTSGSSGWKRLSFSRRV